MYVDFFFILQGFYLIKTQGFEKNVVNNTKCYFIDRLKRFFPCVFASSLLMLGLEIIINLNDKKLVVSSMLAFLWQISFVSQFFDFVSLEVGGIFWFLSASIIIGTLLVYIYQQFEKKFIIVAPFIISWLINYFYSHIGNMDVWGTFIADITIRASLIRAFMDILIGMVAKKIYDYIHKIQFRKWVCYCEIITSLAFAIVSIFVVLYMPHSKMDFYMLLVFAIMLILLSDSMNNKSNYVTDFMEKMCMPMYIFQVCSFLIVNNFIITEERNILGLILVLLIDCGLSVIWMKYLSKISMRKIFIKGIEEE